MRKPGLTWRVICMLLLSVASITVLLMYSGIHAGAQEEDAPDLSPLLPEHLAMSMPSPQELAVFIKNNDAAVQLGKALFWDMQVGSDNVQACASCHSHAGADYRVKNTLSPGGPNTTNRSFDAAHGGAPNYVLKFSDFPFTQRQNDDVTSSEGVFTVDLIRLLPPGYDQGAPSFDPVFSINGLSTRRVEPRHSPTVINAVFNYRNFWDGRAHNIFNGVNPFGIFPAGEEPTILEAAGPKGPVTQAIISIDFASLASQAVGPPLSSEEMSFKGRLFPHLGKKMISLTPLAKQKVHPQDSVLGPLSKGKGLNTTYKAMIEKAFHDKYWNSDKIITFNADGSVADIRKASFFLRANEYTLMQANFSLFFGLSVMMYEATLVSDQTPFDRNQLTAQQQQGLELFKGKGKCANCHDGPLFSNATVPHIFRNNPPELIELMEMGNVPLAVYDNGFYNIGVRPSHEDNGIGNVGPAGPFSLSVRALENRSFPGRWPNVPEWPDPSVNQVAVIGSFKVPTMRNVELTGPYFHNGGMATLEQVVDFYNDGGAFPSPSDNLHLDPDIQPLGLNAQEKAALVSFLKALTDERVRFEQAPFDHPELIIPHGHVGDTTRVYNGGQGKALSHFVRIPEVGANGGPPLQPFANQAAQKILVPVP